MMPIWLPLWQLANVSNGAGILIIVALLITMITYIARIRTGMNSSSCVVVAPNPTEVELTYQSSPFQVTLSDPGGECKQNLESGVRVVLSSQKPYWFMHLWGCEITPFHEAVASDWRQTRQAVIDGTFLEENCVDRSDAELMFETEKSILLNPSRPISATELGSSPRSLFPLVLIMILGQEEGSDPLPTDTVALICAIHVQDSVCTSDTSFVFKLSKLANGQVLNVSHLFTRDAGEEATICLICEARRVTIGLLPCRHFSLCETCYSMLEAPKRCPVCRSYIVRFFRHKMTEEEPANGDDQTAQHSDRKKKTRKANWIPAAIRHMFTR